MEVHVQTWTLFNDWQLKPGQPGTSWRCAWYGSRLICQAIYNDSCSAIQLTHCVDGSVVHPASYSRPIQVINVRRCKSFLQNSDAVNVLYELLLFMHMSTMLRGVTTLPKKKFRVWSIIARKSMKDKACHKSHPEHRLAFRITAKYLPVGLRLNYQIDIKCT